MRVSDLRKSRELAIKFSSIVKELLDHDEAMRAPGVTRDMIVLFSGAKLRGSVKRLSMDLTRALADLRHPRREDGKR